MIWRVWFIFFSIPLFSENLEDRVEALELQIEEITHKTASQSLGANFSPESPQSKRVGVFFSGNALYWNTKIKNNSSGLHWGYRVGLGLNFPIFDWKVLGSLTQYKSNLIDYNALNLLVRKSSFLGSFFGIETSLGLKEIQIRQDSVFFKGLGPQIGYSLNWNLFRGLHIISDVSATLVSGKLREREKSRKTLNSTMAANTNFFVGLGWTFYQKRVQGSFSVGYEADFFWIKRYTVKIRKLFLLQEFLGIDDMVFSGLVIKGNLGF